nr:hypothetical protein FJNOHHKM_00003 [Escherichia coli]
MGKRPIFIVLSGFATTDLSVRFCDALSGGEAYGKMARRGLSVPSLSPSATPGSVGNLCGLPVPLAAAERPSVASQ